MKVSQNFYKHFEQIHKGGALVIVKKLRSFIYLVLLIPIFLISIPTVIIIRLIRPWFLIRWQRLLSPRIGHSSKIKSLNFKKKSIIIVLFCYLGYFLFNIYVI